MNKIILGFVGTLLVISVVAGSAYALFSSQVKVNNVAIRAGNANLEFSPDGNSGWTQEFTYNQWAADGVYPDYHQCGYFWVRNTSSAPLSLTLSAQLISSTGNWGVYANSVTIDLRKGDLSGGDSMTPSAWNTADRPLYITVDQGASQPMAICLNVPKTVDNSIANEYVSTNWIITGTQL